MIFRKIDASVMQFEGCFPKSSMIIGKLWWTRGELKPATGFFSLVTKSHLSITYRWFSSHFALSLTTLFVPIFGPLDAPVMQRSCL